MLSKIICTILVFLSFAISMQANIILPAIFSNHAVLQKSMKTPIWGKADANEKITVQIGKTIASTIAEPDGRWKVELNLQEEDHGPFDMIVEGSNKIVVNDVLIGEVWLCSGQSNMERTVTESEDIKESANPQIRHFHAAYVASPTPQDDNAGKWEIASPETAGHFTAVGYYFARDIQRTLKVPVGLLHASWGASSCEAWTSAEALDTTPDLKVGKDKAISAFQNLTEARETPPVQPSSLMAKQTIATFLFNGMIHPFIPYRIAGTIWFQGEENTERAFQYRTTFPLLISDWRRHWGYDFPFYFCQLANYKAHPTVPTVTSWPELREAQNQTLSLPNTGQAILIDLGEEGEIHFHNKKDAGKRLALIALAQTYGEQVVCSGPTYDSMIVEGDKVRVRFKHTDGGLVAQSLPDTYYPKTGSPVTKPLVRNTPESQIEGFVICGEDKKWVWANASIDGNDILVFAKEVARPIAVRYAWSDNPISNLYNGAGLPAGPFRTDNFSWATAKKRY